MISCIISQEFVEGESCLVCTHFQLMEELAAKEEEDANNKSKGKEEKKEKGKKDKEKNEEEVRTHI